VPPSPSVRRSPAFPGFEVFCADGRSFPLSYYGCSFIRIKGGPLTDSAPMVFAPGANMPSDGCWSAADRPGICPSEPCLGKGISKMRPYGAGKAVSGSGGGGGGGNMPSATPGQAQKLKQEIAPAATPTPNEAGVPAPAPASPGGGGDSGLIGKISVVNVETGEFTAVSGKGEFKLSDYPRGVNVNVEVPGGASSVVFSWDGGSKTENTAPYFVAGNIGTKYGKWWGYPTGREFTFTVEATISGQKHTKSVQLKFD
jgi:hypothetical protein